LPLTLTVIVVKGIWAQQILQLPSRPVLYPRRSILNRPLTLSYS